MNISWNLWSLSDLLWFEYNVGLGDSEPLEETSEDIARSILEGLVHQVAGAFYMHELAFFCILQKKNLSLV